MANRAKAFVRRATRPSATKMFLAPFLCPIRYSLFAIRHSPFATRHFATRPKKEKEAERRQTQVERTAPAGAGRATERSACADPPLRARSPVGVPLSALPQGLSSLTCGSRPGFLGLGRSAALRLSDGSRDAVLSGRYPPHLSQSSRCTRQIGPSAVLRDARNRPSADRNSARGHRPRSDCGSTSRNRPS
jgi:hypothetical protein